MYHQIQEWLSNPLDPSKYGCILNSGGKYEPKYTDKAAWHLQPYWNRLVVAVNLTARLSDADELGEDDQELGDNTEGVQD